MRTMLGTTSGVNAPPPPQAAAGAGAGPGAGTPWQGHLEALRSMGLPVSPATVRLLSEHAGSLPRVIDALLDAVATGNKGGE